MLELEATIRNAIAASGAEAVAVALVDLASDATLLIEADRPFHPASTIKLCVMMEAFRRDAAGTFPLDAPVSVVNQFASAFDGLPYSLDPADDSDAELYSHIGASLPARDLVERMIVRSGNLATNILLAHLGAAGVTAFMHHLGAAGLAVRRGVEDGPAYRAGLNNSATARGLANALVALARHTAVSPTADAEMIAILRRQQFREGIPGRLPEGTAVAHKTGWIDRHFHDAAIVFPPGRAPYVLVVITRGLESRTEGPELVAGISSQVFESFVSA